MTSKTRTHFTCSACGAESPRWAGRCGTCGEWNTLEETVRAGDAVPAPLPPSRRASAQRIDEVGVGTARPVSTGIDELDSVLGGGLVAGSVTLVGGEPGIGKSTLLLQLLSHHSCIALYVSAE